MPLENFCVLRILAPFFFDSIKDWQQLIFSSFRLQITDFTNHRIVESSHQTGQNKTNQRSINILVSNLILIIKKRYSPNYFNINFLRKLEERKNTSQIGAFFCWLSKKNNASSYFEIVEVYSTFLTKKNGDNNLRKKGTLFLSSILCLGARTKVQRFFASCSCHSTFSIYF